MKPILSILGILFFSVSALAHDPDQMGVITGKGIHLFSTDHAYSGQINGQLVYASQTLAGFVLKHRAYGDEYENKLESMGGKLVGTIENRDKKGNAQTYTVSFTKAEGATGKIFGDLEGEAFEVTVSSKTKHGNHYVDPHFAVKLGAKELAFDLKNGEMCLGCSIKTVWIVLGMLRSTGAI